VARKPDHNRGCNICAKRLDTLELDNIEICFRSAKECGHILKTLFTLRNMKHVLESDKTDPVLVRQKERSQAALLNSAVEVIETPI